MRPISIRLAIALMLGWAMVGCGSDNAPGSERNASSGDGVEHGVKRDGGDVEAMQFERDDRCDFTQNGVRLVLVHDQTSDAFIGMVQNATAADTMHNISVEVHLSNGTGLGPTRPVNLIPGDKSMVALSTAGEVFDAWSAYTKVGAGNPDSD